MAERNWTVGSLPDCDIRVENSAVSGRHCRLTQRGESLLLEDLGSTNGTFVAGQRLTGPRIVRRGDRVTLGRNLPLTWPPIVRSVTIGRLPDNDIVIPLDMISGWHARLDQETDTFYLIDADSTNGTAINDPLNKITRAVLHPTDQVFFGTHKVAAAELLKALPSRQSARHTTVLEGNGPDALERELAGGAKVGAQNMASSESPWDRLRSRSSWAWGVGLSALCALLILGAPMILGSGARRAADDSTSVVAADGITSLSMSRSASIAEKQRSCMSRPELPPRTAPKPGADSQRAGAPETTTAAAAAAMPAPTEPKSIDRWEGAVVLVGVRIEKGVVIDSVSAWACGPDAVICPTSTLEMLETEIKKFKGLDSSLVVCTPKKTLAILEHIAGQGPAAGFSLAKLEAPLDIACTIAAEDVPIGPEQQLNVLAAHSATKDSFQSIVCKTHPVSINHIERSEKFPVVIHCRRDQNGGDLTGAPVFDGSGVVVGCVVQSADGVDVVPVARLKSLLNGNP